MRHLRILAVGRLKTPHWREAAAHYSRRMPPGLSLEEGIVKDADPGLPVGQRKEQEGVRLLKLLRPGDLPICMEERGRSMTSRGFANFLQRLFQEGKTPSFIIGGAYGLAPSVLQGAFASLSLGAMTFPHELARVLLLEQIYRAENILAGTGYHH